ncbi:hypothetical protein [Stenoxybacter acetivorans]|uniref:hypothetical protein n=1 Tax=Stenoxybacter acetivorans TaxID=422441 RepID=UPI00056B238B|nr:hypothetical protein [Stenoxybacter acetivorans]
MASFFSVLVISIIPISIYIIIIGIIGIGGWIIYFLYSQPKLRILSIFILLSCLTYYWLIETNIKPYQYWYQLMDKNPKPWNVSFEEFSRRNREGYCWADKKTYTKEELKEKAIISYIKMELLKIKSLREGWIESVGGYYEERSYLGKLFFRGEDCRRFRCEILMLNYLLVNRSPVFEKAQKLIQENAQKNTKINQEVLFDLYDKNSYYLLTELDKMNSIEIKDDYDFLSYNKKYNDLIIVGREGDNKRLSLMFSTYSSVISNQDKAIDQRELKSVMNRYFPSSSIPKNINIHDYGVGVYYFFPNKIYLDEEDTQEDSQKYGKKILFRDLNNNIYYPISNCGDLLIYPVYSMVR